MRIVKKALVILACGWSSGYAALQDYNVQRLPGGLAQQTTLDNGRIRVSVPSSINNAGVLGGFRATWTPRPDGTGLTTLNARNGYLYDLESRSFIARRIPGHFISYVGDTHYISKTISGNGRRWRTFRCPLNGLVERAEQGVFDNPGCERIDNDLLDQTPNNDSSLDPIAFWHMAFVQLNGVGALSGLFNVATNVKTTSFVMDFPDDYFASVVLQGHLYRQSGETQSTAQITSNIAEALGAGVQPSDVGATLLGHAGGEDVLWAVSAPASMPDTAPVNTVNQLQFMPDGSLLAVPLIINWQDADGRYAQVQTISENGRIVTDLGACTFSAGCTDRVTFGEPVVQPALTLVTDSGLWFTRDGLLDVTDANAAIEDPWQLVDERFGEQKGAEPSYQLPNLNTGSRFFGAQVVSETGGYILLAARMADGRHRVYLLRR